MSSLSIRFIDSLASITPPLWNSLAPNQPFLSHAFLHGLHTTGCAATQTGWTPRYATAWRGDTLVGAMPLYLKAHSYGEYVFDWSWADAYRRYGRSYYPKLLAAVPFTPVTGPRLLSSDASVRRSLLAAALALMESRSASSLHILFPEEAQLDECRAAGMMMRDSVQFHWTNAGYRDFADFLAGMSHDKRKRIKQERRKLAEADVTLRRETGASIRADDLRYFFRCYTRTYREHYSTPYLTFEFFEHLAESMPENILVVIAERHGKRIAAALDVYGGDTLWGRYWGATEPVSGLHFEACYYQAIEFCIERGLRLFEGGAQGTHKLARGLLPVATHSAHVIADPQFAAAIADFVSHERVEIGSTIDELERASPFREETRTGSRDE